MKKNILGEITQVKSKNFNTLAEAGVRIYQGDLFAECFGDIAEVTVDATVALVTQPLLSPVTSLEIIPAVEANQLIAGIGKNQLAWFLLNNRGCDGWFVAHVIDKVRTKEDEEHSFAGEDGERLVLRSVDFGWVDDEWSLSACRISDPDQWDAGSQVLSRNSSVPQS
ncbi:MAG: hypothetical protein WC022_03850 [Parcubacteria group bacterium]